MNWAYLHLGALWGLLSHPLLWIWFSPQRWLLYVGVTAAQESGGNPEAYNPELGSAGGDSKGMLQFQSGTWAALSSKPESDRTNPFWSGYTAASYVQTALLSDFRWWLPLALPVYGMGAMRRLWRSGIGSADGVWSWADTGATAYAGSATWSTYLRWVPVALALTVIFCMAFKAMKKAPVVV
jgi:hypothetical protein